MTIEARLETLKRYKYFEERSPDYSQTYIDDLNLSIAMFEKAVSKKQSIVVMRGGLKLEE
jgi:hypothetical protein